MQIQLLQNIQKVAPLRQNYVTKPSFKGTDDAFIPSEKTPTDYEKFETWAKKANLGETIKSTILNQENILIQWIHHDGQLNNFTKIWKNEICISVQQN